MFKWLSQGLPEPSFLTLSVVNSSTRAAEHQSPYWGMQMIDCCRLKLCVATHLVALSSKAPQKKINAITRLFRDGSIGKFQLKLHCTLFYILSFSLSSSCTITPPHLFSIHFSSSPLSSSLFITPTVLFLFSPQSFIPSTLHLFQFFCTTLTSPTPSPCLFSCTVLSTPTANSSLFRGLSSPPLSPPLPSYTSYTHTSLYFSYNNFLSPDHLYSISLTLSPLFPLH